MAVSIAEFWKLLLESRLVGAAAVAELQEKFGYVHGGDAQAGARALAEWLVKQRVISAYQANVLLAGHAGPFVYGDYVVYDRQATGRLKGAFKALHPVTRFRVLLVFHSGPQADHPQLWSALARQIERFAQIVQPQVGRVFQVCACGSYKFTAVEYLKGQSADERLAGRPIPWGVACRMARQAAAGVAALMDAGEIHGAVRPRNLWIDRQENVKLLLPPLVCNPLTVAEPIGEAADAAALETADYAAPELAEPGRVASPQTEVYSLGCTLYHLIAGRPPFSGDTVASKRAQHARSAAPSLELVGAPAAVAQITAQMMAKDPVQRLKHPRHVADALASILRQLDPGQLNRPASEAPRRLADYEAWLAERKVEGGRRKAEQEGQAEDNKIPEAVAVEDEPQVVIVPSGAGSSGTSVASGRRARKSAGWRKLMIAGGIACVLLAAGFIISSLLIGQNLNRAQQGASSGFTTNSNSRTAAESPGIQANEADERASDAAELGKRSTGARDDGAAGVPSRRLVADDGSTLWASPTNGSPLSLEYFVPGVQAVLHFRPAELLKHSEGEKIIAAPGPQAEASVRALETMTGVPLSEVDQVTIGWVESMSDDGATHVAPMYVVRLANSRAASNADNDGVFQTSAGAAYLPAKEQGSVLVVGAPKQIHESMQLAGAAPPLRRELEKIMRGTDSARLVTLAFVPDAPGTGELQSAVPIAAIVNDFLGGDIRAAAASGHLADDVLFLELRVEGRLDQMPDQVAGEYRNKVAQMSESIEAQLATLNPRPYGRRILFRFPAMLKLLDEFTRAGVEEDQAVLRCYLPAAAAHNLLMAAELTLAEGSNSLAAAAGGDGSSRRPDPLADRLKRITTLSFARDTLENALSTLAADLEVNIEILGADLQAEGITKNQSFALDERDKPAEEILRTIMRRANPDGKLVYVIKSQEAGGEERLVITTRAAADKRGEKLPAELAAPPRPARRTSN